MGAAQLLRDLKSLAEAISAVEKTLGEMRTEHDALALHVFIARRDYRRTQSGKSGRRHALQAQESWKVACELGFRGQLSEWQRLLGAAPPR